ncbi:hypothetical protein ScPMuIL_001587 [Solemya velum]
MSVAVDRKTLGQANNFGLSRANMKHMSEVYLPLTDHRSSNKKRRKGKKGSKSKKQSMSMTSVFKIEDAEYFQEKNSFYQTRKKLTKLPSLTSFNPGTPTRLTTPPCRSIPKLPTDSQIFAHERRKKVPLLSAIKPENERSEKDRFMRANFNYNPFFIYRFPADPDVLQKFGEPSSLFMQQAILIMEKALEKYGTYEEFEEVTGGKVLPKGQIMGIIKRYLQYENLEDDIGVNLSDELLSRGSMTRSMGRPMLNVRTINLREFWLEGLLRHEIGTHYIRSYNNKFQPWSNWKVRKEMGLLSINPTEEGFASLHSVLFRKMPLLWRAAVLYYTTYKATFLSLKELFQDLGRFVKDPNVRWDYCIRAKRGQVDTSLPGAFCKDQVYLDGALQILKYRNVIDFSLLVRLGKISFQDIDKAIGYANLENTKIPFFMEDMEQYHRHLDRIAETNGLTRDVLADLPI